MKKKHIDFDKSADKSNENNKGKQNKNRIGNIIEKSPIIEELWIITENGLTLFNKHYVDNFDADLIGGFVSAINIFAVEIGMNDVTSIIGKNFKLSLTHYKNQKLTFICKTKLNVKNKKIYKFIDSVKKRFVSFYEDELECWEGCLSDFKNVEEVLKI